MNRTLQRGKVALALLVILASGVGLGWFACEAHRTSAESPPEAGRTPLAAELWAERALKTLSQELHLTAQQEQQIRPVLQNASVKMDLDRERTLFQLHLQVLKIHDEMRPFLRPEQVPALDRMRERLQQDIKRRFANFLNDPAQPTPNR